MTTDRRGFEEHPTAFRSLDGLQLKGMFVVPEHENMGLAVLVHGGGVTRDEGGFFTRLAAGLARGGVASLRFDLRAHGESDGQQEDLTLAGIVNDIRAAVAHGQEMVRAGPVDLIGTSFGGGISAFFAAWYPDQLRTLTLLNPLLNYKKRFIDDKPCWADDRIDEEAGRELADQGFIAHSPSFKLGRPLLNEVFYLQPHLSLSEVGAPTLFVHGTRDTFIPVDSSREGVTLMKGHATLIEVKGAQHGFAVHDDPRYLDRQTQEWQTYVIGCLVEWISQQPSEQA